MTPKPLSSKRLRSPDGDSDLQCSNSWSRFPGTACGGRFSDTTGERIQARSERSLGCFELPSWRRHYSSASSKAPRVLDLCNWRGQRIED
jgi:hypothetical protein